MEHIAIPDLLKELNRKYNPDFWSEVELPVIVKTFDSLTDEDWEELIQLSSDLSESGKINLSEVCGRSTHLKSTVILTNMVQDENSLIGASAAIQLIEKDYVWDPKVSLVADLKRHRLNLSGYELKMVDRLISRLPS